MANENRSSRSAAAVVLALLLHSGCSPAKPAIRDNTPHPPMMVVPHAERLIGAATDRNIVRVEIEVAGIQYVCSDPAKIELFVFQNISTQRAASKTRDATARFTFKRAPSGAVPTSIPIRSEVVRNANFGFVLKSR